MRPEHDCTKSSFRLAGGTAYHIGSGSSRRRLMARPTAEKRRLDGRLGRARNDRRRRRGRWRRACTALETCCVYIVTVAPQRVLNKQFSRKHQSSDSLRRCSYFLLGGTRRVTGTLLLG
jgi:hypothetical protein